MRSRFGHHVFRLIILIFSVILIAPFLISCGDLKKDIVGTWKAEDETIFQFNANNSFSMTPPGSIVGIKGQYSWLNDTTLELDIGGMAGIFAEPIPLEVTIKGDTLTFVHNNPITGERFGFEATRINE